MSEKVFQNLHVQWKIIEVKFVWIFESSFSGTYENITKELHSFLHRSLVYWYFWWLGRSVSFLVFWLFSECFIGWWWNDKFIAWYILCLLVEDGYRWNKSIILHYISRRIPDFHLLLAIFCHLFSKKCVITPIYTRDGSMCSIKILLRI